VGLRARQGDLTDLHGNGSRGLTAKFRHRERLGVYFEKADMIGELISSKAKRPQDTTFIATRPEPVYHTTTGLVLPPIDPCAAVTEKLLAEDGNIPASPFGLKRRRR
jgi:hypothetical protein